MDSFHFDPAARYLEEVDCWGNNVWKESVKRREVNFQRAALVLEGSRFITDGGFRNEFVASLYPAAAMVS